jgi:hypothetical protein
MGIADFDHGDSLLEWVKKIENDNCTTWHDGIPNIAKRRFELLIRHHIQDGIDNDEIEFATRQVKNVEPLEGNAGQIRILTAVVERRFSQVTPDKLEPRKRPAKMKQEIPG